MLLRLPSCGLAYYSYFGNVGALALSQLPFSVPLMVPLPPPLPVFTVQVYRMLRLEVKPTPEGFAVSGAFCTIESAGCERRR